jgi:hypothetical protein
LVSLVSTRADVKHPFRDRMVSEAAGETL